MPIFRYFVFSGSLLIAILFAVEPYFPAAPMKDPSESYHSSIRIASSRKVPPAIRFDTSQPTFIAPVETVATTEVDDRTFARAETKLLPAKIVVKRKIARLPKKQNVAVLSPSPTSNLSPW